MIRIPKDTIWSRFARNCFMAILLFISSSQILFAQENSRLRLVNDIARSFDVDMKLMKDSIAFYSLAVRIEVNKTNNKLIVERVVPNDTLDFVITKSYEALKKLDYSPIVSKSGRSVIILPIAILMFNYDSKVFHERKVTMTDFSKRINNLFDYGPGRNQKIENYIYLNPLFIYLDKAVYD
ncbi:hypothetical protein [Pedobacter gandavensis]|uniref:hypothetical protein n=1 Tax=Pedobacter gandavensis TaxID=2679963 RepID=UPI002930CFF1|nr:hypothetical protein [Pedobacter gandavensis]